ncbi:MAG: hypothetical protein VYE15_07140 [Myxococcota bacterium]|nr:hypothetical protein [Myxococcota bacterium]
MDEKPQSSKPELPPFIKYSELDEIERSERDLLTDFVTKLCRGILQSSYYSPDHPKAKAGVDSIFEAMSHLVGRWDELTFIVSTWKAEEGIALEGAFQEPVDLEEFMGGTVGEHFEKKMHTFCKRNKLVSFSIKDTIGQDEFHRFIGVFVALHVDMDANRLMQDYAQGGGTSGPSFTQQLLQHDVVNVPVVLEDDLTWARRKMPWRIKVAMVRLGKDLKVIPIYAEASGQQLRDAKMRIMGDILRPLRRAIYLKALFVNLDMLEEIVEEFHGVDIEPDIMEAINEAYVVPLGKELLTEHKKIQSGTTYDEGTVRDDLAEALLRQLGLISQRLMERQLEQEVAEFLREMYLAKAIGIQFLPPEMRARIQMESWAASFLANADGFLQMFDTLESEAAYCQQLPNVIGIIPQLVEVKRYAETNMIIDMLNRHKTTEGGFHGRMQIVRNALANLDDARVVSLLIRAMVEEGPEVRETLKGLFVAMGPVSVRPLVQVIDQGKRADVRTDAGLTLVALGSPGVQPLMEILAERGLSTHACVSVINVLSQVADSSVVEALKPYVRHPRSAIRAATVGAFYSLDQANSLSVLVGALDDTESEVICKGIQLLERSGTKNKHYIYKLVELIHGPEDEDDLGDNAVRLAAISAMSSVGNLNLGGEYGTVEDQLLDAFDDLGKSKVLSLFKGGRDEASSALRLGLCDALSRLGGEASVERMEDTSDEPSALVQERMRQTAGKIRDRIGGG